MNIIEGDNLDCTASKIEPPSLGRRDNNSLTFTEENAKSKLGMKIKDNFALKKMISLSLI